MGQTDSADTSATAAQPDTIAIFTDGGCSPNPGLGGWAYVKRRGAAEKSDSGAEAETTNQRMELRAAIAALRSLRRPSVVTLHSDSRYLCDGFTKWLPGWVSRGWMSSAAKAVANTDLWQELRDAAAPHQVVMVWVKGHAGNEINERCDRMVAEARRRFAGLPN